MLAPDDGREQMGMESHVSLSPSASQLLFLQAKRRPHWVSLFMSRGATSSSASVGIRSAGVAGIEAVSAGAASDREPDADLLRVIVPSAGWPGLRLRELWASRELIGFLVWRDIKLRYKQTVLGAMWAIIQPLLTMVVFSLFFGRLAGVPSDGVPYPIFSFAALVPWTLFSFGLTQATQSVVGSQHLITKVYFPRLAIPLAAVLSGLVDFVLACAVLLAMMAAFG